MCKHSKLIIKRQEERGVPFSAHQNGKNQIRVSALDKHAVQIFPGGKQLRNIYQHGMAVSLLKIPCVNVTVCM